MKTTPNRGDGRQGADVQDQQPTQQRTKKFNVPLVKGVIMLLLGALFGALSAVTGISAQIAAVPMIVFLLGFQPAKAQGTALAYSLSAAIGGIAGATSAGMKLNYLVGFLLAFGATIGAITAGRTAAGPHGKKLMRVGQTVASMIAVYVIVEAVRSRVGGPRTFPLEFLIANPAAGAFVVGVASGLLAQLFQVTTGIFLVPALIYFAALRVPDAIATSLIVVAFASLIPTLSYAAKQSIDRGAGYWMCVGGVLGGLAGGMILGRVGFESVLPLIFFGLAAMLLSGWTLSRISQS